MLPSSRVPNDPRYPALIQFIDQYLPDADAPPTLASADASARRYWRVRLSDGSTRVIMDAPPPGENIGAFLAIQARLHEAGVPAPRVEAHDLTNGFLILEDLGDCTLFQWRHGHSVEAVNALLAHAVRLLPSLAAADTTGLPKFDVARLNTEMDLLPDWYAARYHERPFSDAQNAQWQLARDAISTKLQTMPQGFVHRDYHSRNLMVCDLGGAPDLVVIDFQDAVRGPLAYDLVSLLRDSYIDWPQAQVTALQTQFWAQLPAEVQAAHSLEAFQTDFNWVAVQRHLKVLGIFARLSLRDGKHGYLKDIPLTWKHLQRALAGIAELAPLAELLASFAPLPPTPALPHKGGRERIAY
ncbi:MAG TPA: phosphotransferase [Halothiobacillus sp.]|nr:phosphotransferase [Halothiobacillus sp.]HQS29222.1 phosphotransferase [Halothiobacillus sp.]HUN00618.1 phosphotransferase [Halothiobacillus sp.]